MKKLFHPVVLSLIAGIVFALGFHAMDSRSSGNNVAAQATAPSTSPAASPEGAAPAPSAQPLAANPVDTILAFNDAVMNGDLDIMATLTGGKSGSMTWCSKGLNSFAGHTRITNLKYVVTHNNGQRANVNVDAFMTFTDPGGFPAVENVCHFNIDGNYKLEASGDMWIIVKLPGYQEALCDQHSRWGRDRHLLPWPGDAI